MLITVLKKEVLTIEEAALFTRYKVSYLYKLNSQGSNNLPIYAPIEGGKLYFKKEELQEWMLSNKKQTSMDIEAKMSNCLLKGGNLAKWRYVNYIGLSAFGVLSTLEY